MRRADNRIIRALCLLLCVVLLAALGAVSPTASVHSTEKVPFIDSSLSTLDFRRSQLSLTSGAVAKRAEAKVDIASVSSDLPEDTGEYSYVEGDFVITILDAYSAMISTYIGRSAAPALPSKSRGLTVVAIDSYAFYDQTGITSISIPSTCKYIGECAFYGCTALKSVVIPDNSVESIGLGAFFSCSNLTTVSIGKGLTHIGEHIMGETKWYNAQSNGVLYLGNYAIGYKGTMPANYSLSLKSGTLGIADYAFVKQETLNMIAIPSGAVFVGEGAFIYCKNLAVLSIADSVCRIGAGAFHETAWVYLQKAGVIYVGKVAYAYMGVMPENLNLTINSGTVGIADYAFYNEDDRNYHNNITKLTLPSSLKYIGSYSFFDCDEIGEVSVPSAVEEIGAFAFTECDKVVYKVNAANKIFSSYDGDLYNKQQTDLLSCSCADSAVNIATTTENISAMSMLGVPASELFIPANVVWIDKEAFALETEIKTLTVDKNNKRYSSANGLIFNKSGTVLELIPTDQSSLIVPDTVKYIAESAAVYRTELEHVVLSSTIDTIQCYAFFGCTSLNNVTIPQSTVCIGDGAFANCTAMTQMTVLSNDVRIISTALGYYYDSESDTNKKVTGFTISGYSGSTAHKYATDNVFKFLAIAKPTEPPTQPPTEPPILGDSDSDGYLTIIDATTIQKYLAIIIDESKINLSVSDYDNDTHVTVLDATAIQKRLAGIN